jgi:poly(3-hydroxybutyrate) depolymerase
MSGHYATLLRETVKAFLPHREVYITDWQDAREVPLTEGGFDLDDYIETVAKIFRHSGATCTCLPCASRWCRSLPPRR